jgi:hypothetical protein
VLRRAHPQPALELIIEIANGAAREVAQFILIGVEIIHPASCRAAIAYPPAAPSMK